MGKGAQAAQRPRRGTRAGVPPAAGGNDGIEPLAPGRLPLPATSLIGRRREMEQARQLLASPGVRLLTLTGPPGIGKTRLALELVRSPGTRRAGGAVFVPLAPVRDPALVPDAVARALGLREDNGAGVRPAEEVVLAHLSRRRVILVLDNFEHVAGAAPFVAALLRGCPRLTVLVTSRAALHLSGEQEFPVPPLTVPARAPMGGAPPLEETARADAVRLFEARARAVDPAFAVTDANAAAVAEVCRRLDGLPLAIELAAARTRLLPPAAMVQHLQRRLPLLTGGALDLPARQRTLRGAIAWSYDHLDRAERRLFTRLGVFVGGCTLEAARAVAGCGGDATDGVTESGEAGQPDAGAAFLDGLQSLIAQSLVRREAAADGGLRFGMLETLREFAREQLTAADEQDTRRRHAAHFAALAGEAESGLRSAAQAVWLARLDRELPNIRAALEWLIPGSEAGDPDAAELGLRLAGCLWWFWHLRGLVVEGRTWLAHFLEAPAPLAPLNAPAQAETGAASVPRPAVRAQALFAAGFLAWSTGFYRWSSSDSSAARAALEEALAIRRALRDRHGEAYAQWGLALAEYGGDRVRARLLLEESLTRFRAVGDRWGEVKALEHLAHNLEHFGEVPAAERTREAALAAARALGEPHGLGASLRTLGQSALARGDLGAARRRFEEDLAVVRAAGIRSGLSLTLRYLGRVALAEGDMGRAHRALVDSVAAAREQGSPLLAADALLDLARVVARSGRPADALRLGGNATALRCAAGDTRPAPAPAAMTRVARWYPELGQARQTLGEAGAVAAWEESQAWSVDEAAAYAAAASPEPAARSGRPVLPGPLLPLTPREQEVAALIAEGLTNREIAARLVLAERTVYRHVEHILAKLGLRSRTQVATWVVERRPASGRESSCR